MDIVSISLATESWLLSLRMARLLVAKLEPFPKVAQRTVPSSGNSRCLARKTTLSEEVRD
jgi:hypothetical protein